jgi:hypothetical protein
MLGELVQTTTGASQRIDAIASLATGRGMRALFHCVNSFGVVSLPAKAFQPSADKRTLALAGFVEQTATPASEFGLTDSHTP